MIRAIAFSLALMFGVSASPFSQNVQKESATLVTVAEATPIITLAAAEPCPEPIVLVAITPKEVAAKPVVKAKAKVKAKLKKKKPVLTKKQKKKLALALAQQQKKKSSPDHHKSKVPDHHKSIPQNPTSHGPLHLTSPPGCG